MRKANDALWQGKRWDSGWPRWMTREYMDAKVRGVRTVWEHEGVTYRVANRQVSKGKYGWFTEYDLIVNGEVRRRVVRGCATYRQIAFLKQWAQDNLMNSLDYFTTTKMSCTTR